MTKDINAFIALQAADVFTTYVGLHMGLAEASPVVRLLMQAGPVMGLLLAKALAAAIVALALWLRRPKAIRLINWWTAAIVLWNCGLLIWKGGVL